MNKYLSTLFHSIKQLFTGPLTVFIMEQGGFVYLNRFVRLDANGFQNQDHPTLK
jgi:hypothetical protein